jgi:hypothetical protein
MTGDVRPCSPAIALCWGYGWGYSAKRRNKIPPNEATIWGYAAVALTDTAIKNAKPKAKPYKLAD